MRFRLAHLVRGAGKSSGFYPEAPAWAALLLLALLLGGPAWAEDAAPPPPEPPGLVAPPDDPDQDHCFLPDPRQGVRLDWRPVTGPHLSTYIEIRRYRRDSESWEPWVKKYAGPPFIMLVRPSTYDSVFAWRVWAVDRSGQSKPYAKPSEWWLFCTKPQPR